MLFGLKENYKSTWWQLTLAILSHAEIVDKQLVLSPSGFEAVVRSI